MRNIYAKFSILMLVVVAALASGLYLQERSRKPTVLIVGFRRLRRFFSLQLTHKVDTIYLWDKIIELLKLQCR